VSFLKELLSKAGRATRARRKNLKQAQNRHAQSYDRLKALEELAKDGSDEALLGLFRRFSLRYDKTIEDEEEREWVYETLVSFGPRAVPALRAYLAEADSISWPLKVLEAVAPPTADGQDPTLWGIVDDLVKRFEPGYLRDPSPKLQFVAWLGELSAAKSVDHVIPYLEDMDEGVRLAAIEALFKLKAHRTVEPLLNRLVDPTEESRRVKVAIAEGLADTGWELPADRKAAVEQVLPDGLLVERSGDTKALRVRRPAPPKAAQK
jgi:HEAT repeat protein